MLERGVTASTPLTGLFAAGECACVSINGANRLGSNSLTELLVFGKVAGVNAAKFASQADSQPDEEALLSSAQVAVDKVMGLFQRKGGESIPGLRNEMNTIMEAGAGIYRSEETLTEAVRQIGELRERFANVELEDKSNVYNTDLVQALELGSMIEVARAMAVSALNRRESRGSHQRLDFVERNDKDYLRHTLAFYQGDADPEVDYRDVVITKSQPAVRVYGGPENEH